LTGGYSDGSPDNGQRHYPAHDNDKEVVEAEVDRPLDFSAVTAWLETAREPSLSHI
jgi:hypothetical protein